MKLLSFAICSLISLVPYIAVADQSVQGYTKKDGTYVQPYHRTEPNDTRDDNYSTKGNVNPYTGKKGTAEPDNAYDYSKKNNNR